VSGAIAAKLQGVSHRGSRRLERGEERGDRSNSKLSDCKIVTRFWVQRVKRYSVFDWVDGGCRWVV